jgi:hypothetical protein
MDAQKKLNWERKRLQRDIDSYDAMLQIPAFKFYAIHTVIFTFLIGGPIFLINEYPNFDVSAFCFVRHFLFFFAGGIFLSFSRLASARWHKKRLLKKLERLN